jgi:hypothetical protein
MSTLREQFEAFEQGTYLDSDGNLDNRCFNFYDWFCKDTSLKSKANKLFPMAIKFANKMGIDLDKHYVFFKNNCPVNHPLYDDFRICDKENGWVVFTVVPKEPRSGKTEVWGRENDFDGPLFQGRNLDEIYKNLA